MKKLFRSRLIQNVGALSLLQVANYLVPLLTIPYLTRTLGMQAFGLTAFVQVLMAWLVTIVNYGFVWSATRDIAARRDDPEYVSRQFAANWAAQWLLTLFVGIVLTLVVWGLPDLRQNAFVYLAGFSLVLGTTLFPLWLMQGLERLREVAVIQLCGRLALLVLVFMLVHGPEDVALAVGVQGFGGMVAGILCIYWIRRQKLVRFVRPKASEVLEALRSGGRIFISQIAISFYSNFVPTALGLGAGAMMVGQFMVADRARVAAQSLITPISQALFPRLSFLVGNGDFFAARRLIGISILTTLVISSCSSITLFMLADWIVLVLGGGEFTLAAPVLRWMSWVPICVGLSNIFGVQIMLPRGRIRAFNTILISAAVLGASMIFPMANWRGAEGAGITILVVEIYVTAMMAVYLVTTGLIGGKTKE